MRSCSPRIALTLSVLVGLVPGCTSSGTLRPEAPAATTTTAADIERNSSESIEKILQAKAPGVLITRTPDGAIALQIRGTASFGASSAPLIVIDDAPMEGRADGVLSGINPYDIESIRVLKDPADIAIYGMRGANGVILVKTKRPGKRDGR